MTFNFQLPSFGNNLSEDPHSVVIAHVLKIHIIYLESRQKKQNKCHCMDRYSTIKILPSKFQQMQNNAKCIDAASFQPTNLFSRRVFNSGRSRSGANIKERREEGKGEAHSSPQTDVKKKKAQDFQ